MALDILHLTGFTAIRIFLKNVIREGDKKEAGCEIFVKKEQECGIRAVFSLPADVFREDRISSLPTNTISPKNVCGGG